MESVLLRVRVLLCCALGGIVLRVFEGRAAQDGEIWPDLVRYFGDLGKFRLY